MTTSTGHSTGQQPFAAAPLRAGDWAVDHDHSSIGFSIRHLGVSKVRGRFNRFDAQVQVGDSLPDTWVSAVAQVDSLDTGNADRDKHVLSADLLDVASRPTMTFRSTSITGSGADWLLRGDLTIGEVTAPLELELEFGGVQDFADGTRHAGFEARGQLRRRDFGLNFGPPGMLGDVVRIELDIQLIEPA